MRPHALFPYFFLVGLLLFSGPSLRYSQARDYPLTIQDSLGRELTLTSPPQRVVCLLSSVTDLLVELGRSEVLAGLTRQDLLAHSRLRTPSMGSFSQPDLTAIEAAQPDLIIASTSQQPLRYRWQDNWHQRTKILFFDQGSLEQGFARMALIGRLVERGQEAQGIIDRNREQIAALLDLDIRSTSTPWPNRATGTGTDSMIVVQGEGPLVRHTGGHGKVGELTAKAVHAGVTEALIGQNGIQTFKSMGNHP